MSSLKKGHDWKNIQALLKPTSKSVLHQSKGHDLKPTFAFCSERYYQCFEHQHHAMYRSNSANSLSDILQSNTSKHWYCGCFICFLINIKKIAFWVSYIWSVFGVNHRYIMYLQWSENFIVSERHTCIKYTTYVCNSLLKNYGTGSLYK